MAYQHVQQVRHTRGMSDETIVVTPEGAGAEDVGVRGPYHFINMDTGYPSQDQQFQKNQQFQQDGPYQSQQQQDQQQYQQQEYRQDLPYQLPEIQHLQPSEKQQQQFQDPSVTAVPGGWDRGSANVTTDGSSQRSRKSGGSMFSKSNSWTLETVSMAVAVIAVAAIIAVLAYYDQKPLPSWPYSITLNAVIAILATVATASMGVPLSSGLGQLKWIRFKQGRAPLSDMEIFDDASRGVLGAVNLLFRARGGVSGSFGAFVMIIALLLSPFAQQIATYPTRLVRSTVGASNWRTIAYGIALRGDEELSAFVPILPLKAAVYNGLFAENGKPWTSLPVTCATGNCVWDEPFETLAVCHACVDMSAYISRHCYPGTTTDCGWALPSGAKLNTSAEVFSMTSLFPKAFSDTPYSTLLKLVFMGTEAQDGTPGEIRPWAQQCTLSACVQTLSANVTNGNLNETVISTLTNDTVPNDGAARIEKLEPIHITSPATNTTYNMTMPVVLGMQSWFADLFRNGSASRNAEFINRTISTVPGSPNVVVNLTVGISSGTTFFDTDIVQAFYWNYYEYPSGLEMLMRDMAISTTVSLRSIGGNDTRLPVNGTAISSESYVRVRWGFVAVPVLAVLLTAVFLATAIAMTRRSGARLWKTSALAMLFHGLDEDARERFEDFADLRAKRREARGVKVILDENGGGSLKIDRVY
ncbi:hypothetical protein B0T19DRAFT_482928 [Cercophora scortea]|uniref:Uncharacterized protein n=1 Tax=Cercophora scortea TaxID=314031 RepID=A0AAE0IWR7_9PEZI|nr:hypothetical protein B0T19DRAFT_482928 [Cercophora scortea]